MLEEEEGLVLTPFERNLEVRRLTQTLARAHALLLQRRRSAAAAPLQRQLAAVRQQLRRKLAACIRSAPELYTTHKLQQPRTPNNPPA